MAAPLVADRVRETSSTTGTGNLSLGGAVVDYQAFSSAFANGSQVFYCIELPGAGEWEVGIGTYNAGVLTRDTILASSNSGNAVNFSAGTKSVFCTFPAAGVVRKDASGNVAVAGTLAVTGAVTLSSTLSVAGQLTSTIASGTAPLVVASNTVVANLNASLLLGATWAAPSAIGSTTPAAGAFTTISATGAITSTLASGNPPLVVASNTVVANLNASLLLGATWAAPSAIGSTTPAAGAFTTISATGAITHAATVTVASATTTDIGAAASNNVDISGTVPITGFGTIAAGAIRRGRFTGITTLTHNATSLILPGAANITTAANDRYEAISLGSGNWLVLNYARAANAPVVLGTMATKNSGQSAFLAVPSAALVDVTGNNVLYTVVWDTEIFDRTNDFSSTTFTAPVAGIYQFNVKVSLTDTDTSMTDGSLRLITSNRTYDYSCNPGAMEASASFGLSPMDISVPADMDAGDTAVVKVVVVQGTQIVDVAPTPYSHFSGFLVQ